MIGIVLATGIYMIFSNCFGKLPALTVNLQAIIISVLLAAAMFTYKHIKKKKLSPIELIIISACLGIVLF